MLVATVGLNTEAALETIQYKQTNYTMPGKKITAMAQRMSTKKNKSRAQKEAEGKKLSKQKAPGYLFDATRVRGCSLSSLDNGAHKWAELLNNPCGAEMVHPVYSTGNGGLLSRVRQVVVAGNNGGAVDSVTCFIPNGVANSPGNFSQWVFGYASAAGGSLGTFTGTTGPAFLGSQAVGTYRPVAGCIRAYYTGTELNRSGLVSYMLAPTSPFNVGNVNSFNAAYFRPLFQKTVRIGDSAMEARWLPLSTSDESWTTSFNGPLAPPVLSSGDLGSALVVLVEGATAGSIQVEIDFCYEWQPNAYSQLNIPVAAPVSVNTTGHVIKALADKFGGVTEFAIREVAGWLGGTPSVLGAVMSM